MLAPPTRCTIPNDETVGELLETLVGREVKCAWTPGTHPLPDRGQLAVYSDDSDITVAVAVADVGFVCRSGGALVMMPPGGLDEAVDGGEYPESIVENFSEVVNIMASLLNSDASPHVRLTHVQDAALPIEDPRAPEIMAKPSKRRVFDVTITGYGRGRIIFLFP